MGQEHTCSEQPPAWAPSPLPPPPPPMTLRAKGYRTPRGDGEQAQGGRGLPRGPSWDATAPGTGLFRVIVLRGTIPGAS